MFGLNVNHGSPGKAIHPRTQFQIEVGGIFLCFLFKVPAGTVS